VKRISFWFICWFIQPLAFSDCSPLLASLASEEPQSQHQEILKDLERGYLKNITIKRLNGNTHDLWIVDVYNPQTQRTRQALMKPREWGDSDGWARAPMEYVAYRLNRLLGMDYVPPTVYRYGFHAGNKWIHEAPLILWVPSSQTLYETSPQKWGLSKEAIQSDHRILSVLLHNSDGHYKNLLLGQHWVNGRPAPVFIDFGASLRKGTHVTMRHYPALNNSEPVSKIRKSTYASLKALRLEDLLEFRTHLSEEEIKGILSRREGIISYFEGLIDLHGPSEIFIAE